MTATTRLFIGGLPENIDQQWLITRFRAISVHVPPTKHETEQRKFAYVEVPQDQAPFLIKKFHNSKFRGNQLRVEFAKPNFLNAISIGSTSETTESQSVQPEAELKNSPSILSKTVLKIRVGRKRARESIDNDNNPRHIKFDSLPTITANLTKGGADASNSHNDEIVNKSKQSDKCTSIMSKHSLSKKERRNDQIVDNIATEIIDSSSNKTRKKASSKERKESVIAGTDRREVAPERVEKLSTMETGIKNLATSECKETAPVVSKPTIDFCWTSTGEVGISGGHCLAAEPSQTSFLFSRKQSFNLDVKRKTAVARQECFEVNAEEAAIIQSNETDSKKDSQGCDEKAIILPETGNDIETSDIEEAAAIQIKEADSNHGSDEDIVEPEKKNVVERSDTDCGKSEDQVLDEIRESNKAMLSVFASMFGVNAEERSAPPVWEYDRRYVPDDSESVRKWAAPIEEQQDSSMAPCMTTDKIELASEWSSLWARSDPGVGLQPSATLRLSMDDIHVDSHPVDADARLTVKPRDQIVVRHVLRLPFLDRLAQRYLETGECFLFRRKVSAADLIASCKEAKRKRTHAYKRQIKSHRQSEHHGRRRRSVAGDP